MKKLLVSVLLVFAVGVNAYGQKHPDLSFTDINGKMIKATGADQGVNIPSLKGKVVFLEFFGHRCPPCLHSIPKLIKLQKKYKDKLVILAFEVQGLNDEEARDFAFKKGINYIMVTDKNSRKLVNYIAARAEWSGQIPFMVALNTKGDVELIQEGMIPQDYLEGLIKDLSK